MRNNQQNAKWLALICDASGISMLSAQGRGEQARLSALRHVEYRADELIARRRLEALEAFVVEQELRGCPVRIAFVGAGTVVQRMTLPPLGRRHRRQAVETHLQNFTDGRKLAFDLLFEQKTETGKGLRLLAGGVSLDLSRAICGVCRRAGLNLQAVGALTAAVGAGSREGALIQVILGERVTTIQLFHNGKLTSTRDVLFGRRDFVLAYQRPILAEAGPITLSPEDAERLSREVGVPIGMEHEIQPGIRAPQLWPTLNPVLQRLMHEVQQSLTHGGWDRRSGVTLSLMSLPALPGLDEFLVAELQLAGILRSPQESETELLAALSGTGTGGTQLDLRPPEERFGHKMARPALAAGICALFIVLGNTNAPQAAQARVDQLAPVARQLHEQLRQAREKRAENEAVGEKLNGQLERHGALLRVLPGETLMSEPLKLIFQTLPPEMELQAVRLENGSKGHAVSLRVSYRGRQAASVAAARWSRELSASGLLTNAEVTSVGGSGQNAPAVVEIRARIKGG